MEGCVEGSFDGKDPLGKGQREEDVGTENFGWEGRIIPSKGTLLDRVSRLLDP